MAESVFIALASPNYKHLSIYWPLDAAVRTFPFKPVVSSSPDLHFYDKDELV